MEPLTAIVGDFLRHIEGGARDTPEAFLAARGRPADPDTVEILRVLAGMSSSRNGEIGPYRILRELGRGAQGIVYLAEDTRLRRNVALKVLAPHAAFGTGMEDVIGVLDTVGAVRRFRREVEAAARLDHPGICPVYDAGVAGGVSFIALRHVEGRTLASALASESLGVERACALVESVARALHVAHEAGLVHRDIKPGNIMVTPSGEPVILDFGVARDLTRDLTRTGTLLGTPGYMSPEQILAKPLDARTDVYSLGVLLYECLARVRPFDGPTLHAVWREILERDPPRVRERNPAVPAELEVVVRTTLEKDRERRYRTALDLAEDLRRVRERRPIRARPPAPLLRLRRWTQRNPWLAAIVLLLAAGLASTSHLLRTTSRALDSARALALANAAKAELETDPMLSLLLAREALRIEPHPEVVSALHESVNRSTAVAILPHPQSVTSVAFSPAGDLLLTGCADGAARIWSRDRELVAEFRGHAATIASARFSPAGDRIVTASQDGTARVWDLAGATLAVLAGHDAAVLDADFSRDGLRIVTASADATARVWSAAGEPLRTLRGHGAAVRAAAFSPDGRRIATVSDTLRLWDEEREFRSWARAGRDVAFSPHGDRILLVGPVTAVLGVDGEEHARFGRRGVRGRFCGRGILLAEGWDRTATLWSAEGEEIQVLRGHSEAVNDVACSPDGRFVATASRDRTARVWEPARGEAAVFRGHEAPVLCAAFSRDGTRVVTASEDGTARVWTLDGVERLALPHPARVSSAVFDPGGARVLTSCNDGAARLWAMDGAELAVMRHEANVLRADFSADGRFVVTAGDDGEARMWDSEGRHIRSFRHPHPWVKFAAFSPDGRSILTACRDNRARLWSLEGELLLTVRHEDHMACAVFSPSGDHFATATATPGVRVWRADGSPRSTCVGPAGFGVAAFSPDGARLATVHDDGTARVWSLDGTELFVLRGHDDAVRAAAFSPDGRLLLTASRDGTARLWHTNIEDLARVADERILRRLTPQERRRFVY